LVRLESGGAGLKSGVSRAFDLVGFEIPSSVKTVVIKVNLCYYWNASTGQTTDPLLVSALIQYLRERCGHGVDIRIVEADASAMQTKYAFRLLGYTRLAEKEKVKLVNLSEDLIEEKELQINGRKIALRVPKMLFESDLFINMPKLKVMRATHISCAMKNLFGCIALPRKVKYHPFLAEAIVAINKVLKPHINLVDGIVALGKYPVKLNLLMAAQSTFAADYVAAQVRGYNPSSMEFLNLSIKELHENPNEIDVLGEAIEPFRKCFPTENIVVARAKMRLQLFLLKTYSRLSGDIIPPSIDDA
jgi:uncharacterized protein (DUF362 family)